MTETLTAQREPTPAIPKVQPLVAEIQNFAQDVFDTVREPLLVLQLVDQPVSVSFDETRNVW